MDVGPATGPWPRKLSEVEPSELFTQTGKLKTRAVLIFVRDRARSEVEVSVFCWKYGPGRHIPLVFQNNQTEFASYRPLKLNASFLGH